MAEGWGDRFGSAFTGALDTSQKIAYEKWKEDRNNERAKVEMDIKLAAANLVPDPSGAYKVGNQAYSRRPPIMPDFSKLPQGGQPGFGLTGASVDAESGETRYTFGEMAGAKSEREEYEKDVKSLRKESADYGRAMAIIDEIEGAYKKTTPPKAGMLGIGGAGILPQPFHGMGQVAGSFLGLTENQRSDRKYIDLVNSLQSRLAKEVVGKEGGNLAYQEQLAAKGAVASILNVSEVGFDKFATIKHLTKEMFDARRAGYANVTEKWRAEGRVLTPEKAKEYLIKAKGNKAKAELMATNDRWAF